MVNGFNILDPEMTSLGTGIYLGVSIIDHSCEPTAVAVFSGTTIVIRSLVDIPEFNWSKVQENCLKKFLCQDTQINIFSKFLCIKFLCTYKKNLLLSFRSILPVAIAARGNHSEIVFGVKWCNCQ